MEIWLMLESEPQVSRLFIFTVYDLPFVNYWQFAA
jgi:hypothetical protein